jgi:erythromycin esterase-like protein
MSQDIRDFLPASCDLLALGEPTHREPAFGALRNDLLARLVGFGFRSIVLETDRVAAFTVDDHVRHGAGSLDAVLRDGFTHDFGALEPNRRLVAWLRDHNRDRPAGEQVSFHGFDAPTENTSAPSPRRYLEYARDHLRLDLDVAGVAGDDERWSRAEAILDHRRSMGETPEAARLRAIGEDLRTRLYASAPELIAGGSRDGWLRARAYLDAGLGLLHYHRQAARPLDLGDRIGLLLATRDTLMARNLRDIRRIEAERGPTLVFAHNLHLQRNRSVWTGGGRGAAWFGAGAIADAVGIGSYVFVAGSLGRSAALGLGEPDPDTYEGRLRQRVTGWGLLPAGEVAPARTRPDTTPQQGYFPLDRETVAGADAILHVTG